jgi:hypothetical protein
MTRTDIDEYNALRATIRERGTTRVWIVLAGVVAWAAGALASFAASATPFVTLIPLLVLATTFEVAFALHIGVERVGRYIQVFFEDPSGSGWEHRIMDFSRSGRPRVSTDPLFVRIFVIAGVLNLMPAIVAGPVMAEWSVLGVAHVLFAVRVLIARRQAAGQRAADLTVFREIKQGRSS